jgi:L,D-peptidoglycan transpeptidase YkuD (ErfK/YbiS/YcfS/YnhG family)
MPSRRVIQQHNRPAKLIVKTLNASAQHGILKFGALLMPCALGRSGVKLLKREGDGATPRGRFLLRSVYFRPDVRLRPRTALRLRAVRKADGWCDSPFDRNYNRRVALPYEASAESLWRNDGVYDVVVVLDYNDVPRIKNRGSAIFMHVAKPGFPPTEGCIALRMNDLRRLLGAVPRHSEVIIEI